MAAVSTSLTVEEVARLTAWTSAKGMGRDQAARLGTPSLPLNGVLGSGGRKASRPKAGTEAAPFFQGETLRNASAGPVRMVTAAGITASK